MSSSERQSESAGTLASATSDEKCDSTALTTPSSMLGLQKNKGAKRGERSERQSEDRDQRQSESGEPSQRRRIRGCYMGGESERQSAREGSRARRCGACGKCASVSDLPTERRPLRFELFVTLVRRKPDMFGRHKRPKRKSTKYIVGLEPVARARNCFCRSSRVRTTCVRSRTAAVPDGRSCPLQCSSY